MSDSALGAPVGEVGKNRGEKVVKGRDTRPTAGESDRRAKRDIT